MSNLAANCTASARTLERCRSFRRQRIPAIREPPGQQVDPLCLLKKHVAVGAKATRTLQEKRIHPHSLRHTTAIFLLKAGVDFATISQWLGHSSLNTTMTYARADIDLKRQALMQVFPEILAPPRGGQVSPAATNIVDWLKRL